MTLFRRPILSGILLSLAFFALLAFFIPIMPRTEMMRALALGTSAAVGVRYFSVGWRNLFRRDDDMRVESVLAVGIAMLWLAEPLTHMVHFLWRVHGQPSWMVNNDVMALLLYLKIIAASLHILAPPGAIDGRIPPENKWTFIGAIVVGVLVFVAAVSIAEPPVGWLDWLRPWLEYPGGGYTRAETFDVAAMASEK